MTSDRGMSTAPTIIAMTPSDSSLLSPRYRSSRLYRHT